MSQVSVAVLLGWPPTRDNTGWPTALPWYLLANAPENLDIHLFYFRGEAKHRERWERDLQGLRLASVTELEPYWTRLEHGLGTWNKAKRQGFPVQVDWFPVRRRTLRQIHACRPDVVWLYPHWLSRWVPEIKARRIVVTGPDCAVLHHERVLKHGVWRKPEDTAREKAGLGADLVLEMFLASTDAAVHVVGRADAERFNQVAGRKVATYTVHPHFDYIARPEGNWDRRPLRVLMSGDATSVYFGDHAERIASSMAREADTLRERISVTLVGRNWESIAAMLGTSGYSVRNEVWVGNYPATLAAHDVALCPYAVGVGTKGKVLQAMAGGLLTIGSAYSFENIEAESPATYESPEHVPGMLASLTSDATACARLVRAQAEAVRQKHSPHAVADSFWALSRWQ